MEQREIPFDDAEYIKRTLKGDRLAYDTVVNQYAGMVHAIALARLNRDFDQSNELTQEVFLRAWLHLHKLSKPENLPAWLCQITRNLAADWKRRDRRKSAVVQMVSLNHPDALAASSDHFSPHQVLVRKEEGRILDAALKKLSADQRELLLLHYSEGISKSEIAGRLRVHPSTVTRKIDRAAQRLGALYNDGFNSLNIYRTHTAVARRTSAVIAAVWLLNATQRTALAQAALETFATPTLGDVSPFNFFQISGGQAMAGAGLVLIMGIIWVVPSLPYKLSAQGFGDKANTQLRSTLIKESEANRRQGTSSKETAKRNGPLPTSSPQRLGSENPSELVQGQNFRKSTSGELPHTDNAHSLQNGYVAVDSQPSCVNLEQLQALTRSFENVAATAQFTFNTSQTVFGVTDAKNRIDDREGTVTMKNGSYLVVHRQVNGPLGNSAPVEEIRFDASSGVVTVKVPGFTPRLDSGANRHTYADVHNPLRKLLRPPFGSSSDSFGEFLSQQSQLLPILTTCTKDSKGSRRIQFGTSDFMVRLDPENGNFPDYMQAPSSSLRLEKEVTRFSSHNGVAYPSRFAIRSYGLNNAGEFVVINATTATIQMFGLSNGTKSLPTTTTSTAALTTGTSTTLRSAESEQSQQDREDAHHNRIQEMRKRLSPG